MDYTKYFAKITSRRKTNLIRKLTELSMTRQNTTTLAGGMPNTATFPIKDISVTYEHGSPLKFDSRELAVALQYGPSQGYPPLVEKWREFQKTWHTPKRNDWDVAFTNGSLDGCSKIFEMMLNENEPIIVQAPTYTGTIGALAPLSPDVIEIGQDADGIIPEGIARECERRLADGRPMPKLLYVNPTGANPTGTVLSESRRREVYELAQRYDFLIVEDDAYYFVHFLDKQPTSFFSLDTDGRVIRLDSFSKVMSAGLRVGAVTAHKDILSKLIMHMENTSFHASSLSQMLIYKLLEAWRPHRFEEHFENVQKFYRERRDAMLASVEKHLTDLAEWNVPQGGMFLWVKVTAVDDVMDLAMNKCVSHGVFVVPGHAFNYDSTKPDHYLRLSYSYASPEDMDKALSVIAKVIREEAAAKKRTKELNTGL